MVLLFICSRSIGPDIGVFLKKVRLSFGQAQLISKFDEFRREASMLHFGFPVHKQVLAAVCESQRVEALMLQEWCWSWWRASISDKEGRGNE